MNRILLADDDPDIRIMTKRVLELDGKWEVLLAASGTECVALALAEQPEAILLDIAMPDMGGLETFEVLQSSPRTRDIPTLVFTAKVQAEDRQRFARLGLRGVISKPFDPFGLGDAIATALGWNAPAGSVKSPADGPA